MTKVVYHAYYGSFGGAMPHEILFRYNELAGTNYKYGWDIEHHVARHDPFLVQAVEEYLQSCDSPRNSCFQIHEIVGNVYRVHDYDGMEKIMEPTNYRWIEVNNE